MVVWSGITTAWGNEKINSQEVTISTLSDRPYHTWMISKTPHPFLGTRISRNGILVYQCVGDPKGKRWRTICWIDLHSKIPKEEILLVPRREKDQPVIRGVEGDWILYYTNQGTEWKLTNLRTRETLRVGKIKQPPVQHPAGPFASLSGKRAVWVDEFHDKTGRRNAVRLFDRESRKTTTLFEAPPTHEIDQANLDGPWLVYSLVNLKDQLTTGEIDSNIMLYNMETGIHERLTTTGLASQPTIYYPYVIWKTAPHFFGAGIYVYNVETRKGREVKLAQRGDVFPHKTYQFPRVSEYGVVWEPVGGGDAEVFSFIKDSIVEKFDAASVSMSISGPYTAWQSHSEKTCPYNEQLGCMIVVDLSKPNPTQRTEPLPALPFHER